ncbi:DUF1636 domain-containing protein [Gloeocapsa sp. PCC 73106]|uniref:DUF1636 domain-containing protein n=1 Tax=Gloeocapsa sp. PCC 73106 TaxID=102232 RepID=UPI0002ABD545|nr:DUF1636 domain-containing protein [Gloeocapsa sp. PCC 73106]ELR96884.1 putative metal-binding protein [Gloeocapsa sp. PCC 73106]
MIDTGSSCTTKVFHKILVCSTCASVWENGTRVGVSGGQKLLEALQQGYESWSDRAQYKICQVDCMSACSHACVVGFSAPHKFIYIFGDLPPENTAESILECASKYLAKPDGLLAWKERPEALRKGIIARIPPLLSEN